MVIRQSLPQNARALITRPESAINRRPSPQSFDKSYYDRFYRNPATRAVTPAAARRQAAFIAAYLQHLEVPVRSILDAGCGTGMLLRALAKEFPRARVQGLEFSSYLCERYGWVEGSVVDYQPAKPFDLVVCHDVLAYLDDASCAKALQNLTRLTRRALCLGVLTTEDLALCDPQRTDSAQVDRSLRWYRSRLQKNFLTLGGGLLLKRPPDVVVWSLDQL